MPSNRPIAVLFDLDGTIIDSINLLLNCVRHAFAEHDGRKPTDEEWIAGIGTPLSIQMRDFEENEEKIRHLINRYRTYQREHHDQHTVCYDGAVATIEQLHQAGHPMGIVTSKSNELMHRAMDFIGLSKYMGTLIGADSTHVHKPDPYPVRLALSELGYEPHETVFVGDSPHDINAGNAAGVKTIAALWGPFKREQLEPFRPSYFLEKIEGLPKLIKSIEQLNNPAQIVK
jgi:pyrophosphatase PpaX